jgi:hypothetical protein
MDVVPFRPADLVADEKYLLQCLDAKDWFNIVLFAFENKPRMGLLRTLLKRRHSLPVPRKELTAFLAVGGLDMDVMKCFIRPGWFATLEPGTLSDLYVFNEWVAANLDVHTCEAQLHCNMLERLLVDFRVLRHYCAVRARYPVLHQNCELCAVYAARALVALSELSLPMFDSFTVREIRGMRFLLNGVRDSGEFVDPIEQKLIRALTQ